MRLVPGRRTPTEVLDLTNVALYFVMMSISFCGKNTGVQVGDNRGSINAEIHLPPGKTEPNEDKGRLTNGRFPVRPTRDPA